MPAGQRNTPNRRLDDPHQQRPATASKATSTVKPKLKARSSLSSITNRTLDSRNAADQGSKDHAVSSTGKRGSSEMSQRSTSPTKASTNRSTALGHTFDVENKPAAVRSNPSPNKTPTKPITTTHRSTRPVRYSPQTVTQSGLSPAKKALKDSTLSVPEQPSPTMTRRPPALGRKPTVSDVRAKAEVAGESPPERRQPEEAQKPNIPLASLGPDLQEEFNKKIDQLNARHQKELEAAKAKTAEASARLDRVLNDQLRAHQNAMTTLTSEMALLKKELERERIRGDSANAKAQQLAYESVDLKNTVDDCKDKIVHIQAEAEAREEAHQRDSASKNTSLIEAFEDKEKLEEHLKASADRIDTLQREITQSGVSMSACRDKIHDLEVQVRQDSVSHEQEMVGLQGYLRLASQRIFKDMLMCGRVIGELQAKIEQLIETGRVEVEEQKLQLLQEHDEQISKLRIANENDSRKSQRQAEELDTLIGSESYPSKENSTENEHHKELVLGSSSPDLVPDPRCEVPDNEIKVEAVEGRITDHLAHVQEQLKAMEIGNEDFIAQHLKWRKYLETYE